MKLGFVSALFGDLGLEEVFSFASDKGFACVELMCRPVGKAERRYAGVTHIDVSDLGGDRIASIRGLLKTKGVEISGLGYYPNALDTDLRYDGPVCIEVEDRAFEESLEARKASLVQSRTFVKQFLHIE